MGTFTVGQQPARIWNAGAGSGCIANLDLVNTLYFSGNKDPDTASDTVPPLGAVIVDGSSTLYGSTLSSTQIQVQATPGASSWSPSPAQAAAQIALNGTPLLHGLVNRMNQSATGTGTIAVPAATTVFPFIPLISKPGYLIWMMVTVPGAATVPFLGVTMFWKDSVTGLQTAEELWYIPATSAGTVNIYGKGPTKGNELSIGLQNLDPAQAMTVTLVVWETTQHVARDDWRSSSPSGPTIPGYTGMPSDPFAGIIASSGTITIGANATKFLLLPLYCGQAEYLLQNTSAAAATIEVSFLPIDPNLPLESTYTVYVAQSAIAQPVLSMARAPTLLELFNTTSFSATFIVTGTYLEFAS